VSEDRDPLIDSALEETLGGIQPPDLSQRILLAVREASDNPESVPAIDLSNPIFADGPLPGAGQVRTSGRPERSSVLSVVWTLGVLAAGMLIGLFALNFGQPPNGDDSESEIANDTNETDVDREANRLLEQRGQGDDLESNDEGRRKGSDRIVTPTIPDDGVPSVPFRPEVKQQLVRQWQPPELSEVISETEMVAVVDRELGQIWQSESWEPGAAIADEEWLARVLDRVFGLEPEEVAGVVAAKMGDIPQKRGEVLDQLFSEDLFRRAFATKWSEVWVEHLMLSSLERGNAERREQLGEFLEAAIINKIPLGKWPHALLAAEGTVEESAGAGAWLLGHADRENVHITSAVGEVFLGQRIACARCHDSRDDSSSASGEMAEFWQLNSFFSQLRPERNAGQDVRLVDRDMNEDAIFYELPGGFQKAAYPVFPDGQKIDTDGRVDQVVRRRELGEWIGTSKSWHSVIVQRVWRSLLRSSLDADTEITTQLVQQSASNGGELEALIRWIVLSDAFCRSSHPADHRLAGGAIGMFRANGRLNNTIDLLKVAEANDGGSILFAQNIGDNVNAIAAPVISTMPLLPVREAFVGQIVDSELRWKERIDHLFLYAVGRLPLASERRTIQAIHKKQSDESKALKTIMEVLSNSADGDSLLD
jgi:hypothetical protein